VYKRDWDSQQGCLIHNDANPVKLRIQARKVYAMDFEKRMGKCHPVHDLGIWLLNSRIILSLMSRIEKDLNNT